MLIAVCVLQFLQTIGTLYLPTLNAKIINNGILTGDNGYILRTGALMLAITLVQICFAVGAVYYGSRASMGFGRDVRGNLFHSVTGFSSREVNQFGAPSLITRITNDVQQVQMMVFMTCTLLIAAPDDRDRRHGAGAARRRRAVGDPARQHPRSPRHRRLDHLPHGAHLPRACRSESTG